MMPWVEKYRPATLSDVVAHGDIISTSTRPFPRLSSLCQLTDASALLHPTVDQFISKSRVPHLLFYGPPGTGKTSTILAVARKIYGSEAALRNNCLEVSLSRCCLCCLPRQSCDRSGGERNEVSC